MPEILIRKIPKELKSWIDDQSHSARTSTNAFLLDLLDNARKGNERQLELFDVNTETVESQSSNSTRIPFTFCDLFAGIGGIRLGLEAVGGTCVFSCEYDKYAQKTYQAWFGELPHGDIRDLDLTKMPDHDVLAAGFPCQPFSIAGVSKKNSLGRKHGFLDQTQGTLFFHLATIIELKRPPVILLENVKNLMSHDKGKTWQVIQDTLDKLDYEIHFQVINAADFVPQHRKRVFIVGFDRRIFKGKSGFQFSTPPDVPKPKFRDILVDEPDSKYTLTDQLWNYLQDYAERHRKKGNGFGFGMTDLDGISRTLSARYYKDGSEVLIPNGPRKNPRRLTPREAARLMGFPDHLKIVVSDTQAYKQFGNAVVPPVAESVGSQIAQVFADKVTRRNGCLLKREVVMPDSLAEKAVADCLQHKRAMLKFLSANDTGATGSHQAGLYLPKNLSRLFSPHKPVWGENKKHWVTITWEGGQKTQSVITWYGRSKQEYRLTRFGRDFDFLTPDQIGSLFVLIPTSKNEFIAYVFERDEEIEHILNSLGVELIDGWGEYAPDRMPEESEEHCVKRAFRDFAAKSGDFPSGAEFSSCVWNTMISCVDQFTSWTSDKQLMRLVEEEYRLFQIVERKLCDPLIHRKFEKVDDFLKTAGSIMNRRKSRAGRSLENHVENVFRFADVPFEMRPRQIDGKPDLIAPNEEAYLDNRYPDSLIYVVGIKTTCKDRWRQVLNEGTRIDTKFLLTLQQGISANQLDEMVAADLRLVVPKSLHKLYPTETKMQLMTVEELISEITVAHE